MKTQYEQIFGQMQMIAQELKQRPRGSAEYAEALRTMQELQAQEQQMRQDPAFAEDMAKAMAKISVGKDDQGIWQHQNRIQQMGSTILPAESYQAGEIAGQVVQEQGGQSPFVAGQMPSGMDIDPGRYNPAAGAALGAAQDNGVGARYGAGVASQVAAASAAGKNVGSGGAGFDWDEKKGSFVRR